MDFTRIAAIPRREIEHCCNAVRTKENWTIRALNSLNVLNVYGLITAINS